MRRATLLLLLTSAVLAGTWSPAAADPPREVTVGIQVITAPVFEGRRVTGDVVHFEFRLSAYVDGEQDGITAEHFRCVRRVGEVIRCSGEVETAYVAGSGHTTSHVRLTCDPALFACEGITHVKGVDDGGVRVQGSGRVSVAGGVGQAVLRLTHG